MPSPTELCRKIRQIRKGAVACEQSAAIMHKYNDMDGAANYVQLANNLWDAAFCLTMGLPVQQIGTIDGKPISC